MAAPHQLRSTAFNDDRSSLPNHSIPIPKSASTTSQSPPIEEYQRSASYTYLPQARQPFHSPSNVFSIKGTFSENDLIAAPEETQGVASEASSGWTTPEEHDTRTQDAKAAPRDIATELQQNPKISVQHLVESIADGSSSSGSSLAQDKKSSTSQESTSSISSAGRARHRSSVSTSLSRKLRRRSWYSAATTPDSRSPSPSKQDLTPAFEQAPVIEEEVTIGAFDEDLADHVTPLPPLQPFTSQTEITTAEGEPFRPQTSRRSSLFRRDGRRPLSSVSVSGYELSSQSVQTMPKLQKSFSTDKLTTLSVDSTLPNDRAALPPRIGSSDRLSTITAQGVLRRKDELWGVFRTLDGDYAKFTSKSVALKANVVRGALMPFLRNYANHPSTFTLRAEDLDRRASILDKWWTGLIEMLHGRNNQSLSGTDRPAVLDAVAGIMERPEWRLSPSPLCPIDRRIKGIAASRNRSLSSLNLTNADHIWDNVQQNVQNTFVQNLRSQMAFVVDKMSMRNAAASLVTFCGKACAYAFMFVPGIADILLRVWDVQSDVMRRVLAENGIDRFGNLSQLSDDVLYLFPPCLNQLGFTTLAEYSRKLRTAPPLPAGTSNIQWWGYWLERWSGRESDLFYVFVKHYHILVTEFLPAGSTREERMCVPGMLPVHSQILVNLDATIHRQMTKPFAHDLVAADGASNIDDIIAEPDAVASHLPIIPINATRGMAENRLIMLIRDFLSERAAIFPEARQLFAETFNDLLQASTRGVCVYDPSACYTLLDFAEVALVILVKYEHLSTGAGTLINPDFWHLVSRRMIASENTLTEIRLYAWLYTIWTTVVSDLGRKADLCLGLLLDPAIFASRFNHWSPMVRAYYMRLLCWRVARYDGDDLPGDFEILDTLLERLQTTWSHYLWLREKNAGDKPFTLLSSPCNPAPHRKLRIIRTDIGVQPGSFSSFDIIIAPMISPAPPNTAKSKRLSTLSTLASVAELEARVRDAEGASPADSDSSAPSSPVGIRGFFRTVVGNRSRSQSQTSGTTTTPPAHGSIPIPASRRANIRPGLSRSATDELSSSQSASNSGSSTPTNGTIAAARNFSFKFQMEYSAIIKQPGPLRMIPPRLPAPAQQYLSHNSDRINSPCITEARAPTGLAKKRIAYCGRALAEWALVVGECQSFFDRRRNEGISENKFVETPTLGVEIFKRPV